MDAVDYTRRINAYERTDLIKLWNAIKDGETPDWEAGKALEYLCLRAFQLEGAEIKWPYQVLVDGEELEQIDGVVYVRNLACLIECKDHKTRVNFEPIAKLRNQLLRRPSGVIGSFFSVSGFTDPAVTLARFTAPQTILLWNGDELEYALQKQHIIEGLIAKYRYCVEHGLPNYNIRLD